MPLVETAVDRALNARGRPSTGDREYLQQWVGSNIHFGGMAASACGVACTCLIGGLAVLNCRAVLFARWARCPCSNRSIDGIGRVRSPPPPPPCYSIPLRVCYCTSCLVDSLFEPAAAYVSTTCNLLPGLTELNHPCLSAVGEGLFPRSPRSVTSRCNEQCQICKLLLRT